MRKYVYFWRCVSIFQLTLVKEIADNDYILSANTYSPYNGEEETNHRDPKEIFEEIETEKKKLESSLSEIKKLL